MVVVRNGGGRFLEVQGVAGVIHSEKKLSRTGDIHADRWVFVVLVRAENTGSKYMAPSVVHAVRD